MSEGCFGIAFRRGLCYYKAKKGVEGMEYELVREIKNLCRNNQMRDIFFDEIECGDPEAYVRQLLKGKQIELSREEGTAGQVTIHAVVDGLIQKFVFTPI